MMNDLPSGSGATELARILTQTDRISVSRDHLLVVDEVVVADLLKEFGSPLFILSGATIRANYRRIRDAFASTWPGDVQILYAIKANDNLAVRAILDAEGAGGDCFGLGELYAALCGGGDPRLFTLNGSNKNRLELLAAASLGVAVNVDSFEEIELIRALLQDRSLRMRVNVRLKLVPSALDRFPSDFFALPEGNLVNAIRREKWGFSSEAAEEAVRRLRQIPGVELVGYHVHMARLGRNPEIHRVWGTALGCEVTALCERTGFVPALLDIGGGWPRERDPESRDLSLNPHTIEEYADVVASAVQETLDLGFENLPALWLEPGRYIVGNAGILAGTVGVVKDDLGLRWINVDFSTNELTRIDSAGCAHHVVPLQRLHAEVRAPSLVVGGTCALSVIRDKAVLPDVQRGDGIGVLDAGMYAETTSNRFNGIPSPATVLVEGANGRVVKRRETLDDIFRRQVGQSGSASSSRPTPTEFFRSVGVEI